MAESSLAAQREVAISMEDVQPFVSAGTGGEARPANFGEWGVRVFCPGGGGGGVLGVRPDLLVLLSGGGGGCRGKRNFMSEGVKVCTGE